MLIFFLELAVAVLAFLFQDWVRDRFREFFESNIKSYRDDIDLQNLIDSLQKAVSPLRRPEGRAFRPCICVLLGSQAQGAWSGAWRAASLSVSSALPAHGCRAVQAGSSCALSPLVSTGKSSCPRGHPPPGAQTSRSLATQVAAVPWALWVPRARASPPQTGDSLSGCSCPLPPRDLFPFLFERQSCLEEAASDGEEYDLEQVPEGCLSRPRPGLSPTGLCAPGGAPGGWDGDHSPPRRPVRGSRVVCALPENLLRHVLYGTH